MKGKSMTIYVDADACPVMRIAERVANGWNRILLPFAQAKEITPDQPFNSKAANYFRIYFNGAAASTEMVYGIDAIGFLQY